MIVEFSALNIGQRRFIWRRQFDEREYYSQGEIDEVICFFGFDYFSLETEELHF